MENIIKHCSPINRQSDIDIYPLDKTNNTCVALAPLDSNTFERVHFITIPCDNYLKANVICSKRNPQWNKTHTKRENLFACPDHYILLKTGPVCVTILSNYKEGLQVPKISGTHFSLM